MSEPTLELTLSPTLPTNTSVEIVIDITCESSNATEAELILMAIDPIVLDFDADDGTITQIDPIAPITSTAWMPVFRQLRPYDLPTSQGQNRKVPSNKPLMTDVSGGHSNKLDGDGLGSEYQMSGETLNVVRKKLSEIVEMLTNEKMQRLDNLSKWAEGDADFDVFRGKVNEAHAATEKQMELWRQEARHLDQQQQRMARRLHADHAETLTPNASDLDSDEELNHNWRDYDCDDDFALIHARLKDLDRMFWSEDQFFRKRLEKLHTHNKAQVKLLQDEYAQTTHHLQH